MQIGIIGLGVMGRGIVLNLVHKKYHVKVLTDKNNASNEKELLYKSARAYSKAINTDLSKALKDYFKLIENIEELADCGLIIEAVSEDVVKKKEILSIISRVNSGGVIATNTSSISIDDLSVSVDNPSRFLGVHFMNPPLLVNFVELIKSRHTSASTAEMVKEFISGLNKEYLEIEDIPGFVVNRLLFLAINQSYDLVWDLSLNPADIDRAMKKGANYPVGPIKLSENIGIDICVQILENIFSRTRSVVFKPSELLLNVLQRQVLGKKNNTSVYDAIGDVMRTRVIEKDQKEK